MKRLDEPARSARIMSDRSRRLVGQVCYCFARLGGELAISCKGHEALPIYTCR
jgi:hypothetical protein